jgi:hypothetical protein
MGKPRLRKPRFNMAVGKNSKLQRYRKFAKKCFERRSARKFAKRVYRVATQSSFPLKITFKHTMVEPKWQSRTNPLDGYILLNLDLLQQHVSELTCHTITCPAVSTKLQSGQIETPVKLVADVQYQGLASILLAQCQGCDKKFFLRTSPKINSGETNQRHHINVRAVCGTMVSGEV